MGRVFGDVIGTLLGPRNYFFTHNFGKLKDAANSTGHICVYVFLPQLECKTQWFLKRPEHPIPPLPFFYSRRLPQ